VQQTLMFREKTCTRYHYCTTWFWELHDIANCTTNIPTLLPNYHTFLSQGLVIHTLLKTTLRYIVLYENTQSSSTLQRLRHSGHRHRSINSYTINRKMLKPTTFKET